jgi:GTP-binding protein
LIEGASEGKGLGFQFLRHIERTAMILHLVDVSEWAPDEPVQSLEVMRQELDAYDESLNHRPCAVVATKIDIGGTSDRLSQLQAYCKKRKYKCFPVSAATREGLTELIAYVGKEVDSLRTTPCETNS